MHTLVYIRYSVPNFKCYEKLEKTLSIMHKKQINYL